LEQFGKKGLIHDMLVGIHQSHELSKGHGLRDRVFVDVGNGNVDGKGSEG